MKIIARPTEPMTVSSTVESIKKTLAEIGLESTAQELVGVDIVRNHVDFENDIVSPEGWLEALENAVNNSVEAASKFPGMCEVLASRSFVTINGF